MYTVLKQKPPQIYLFKHQALLFECPYDQQDSYVTAQKPRGRQLNAKVFFHFKTTMFSNDISKTVQVLTVILAQN